VQERELGEQQGDSVWGDEEVGDWGAKKEEGVRSRETGDHEWEEEDEGDSGEREAESEGAAEGDGKQSE
jgi:hypothetical protein